MPRSHRVRRRLIPALLTVGLVITMVSVPAVGSDDPVPVRQNLPLEEPQLVRILVPGSESFYEMQDAGFDFAGEVERVVNGIEVDALLTADQLADLDSLGVYLADEAPEPEPMALSMAAIEAEDTDIVTPGRIDWFTTKGQGFLSLEAKSSVNQAATITASWEGGSVNLPAYVDSGEYMFHRNQVAVDVARPDTVTFTSSLGGTASGTVTDWLYPTDVDVNRPGYQSAFIDGYMDPTELYERLDQLAEEHPQVAEIVELPYATNGYRRLAQAIFGSTNATRVVVDSHAWGHEGGNDISVELANPGVENAPLSVDVDDEAITVNLATGVAAPVTNLRVTVDAPSSAAGAYTAVQASFGSASPNPGTPGDIVVVNDGTANPSQGCSPLVGFPAGAIAVADRGGCPFVQIVGNAQAAGAVAVIVANNVAGNPTAMGGTDPSITIPSVMISQADGNAVKAGLPASGRVGFETSMVASVTSTAAQVVAAINNDGEASDLVIAYTYRGNAGNGVVGAAPATLLSDFLAAPEEISREPWETRALRIGLNRDGSKTGVLIVAQDHAREWVTPLVALEAAERLLANYSHDATTRRILRNIDIFIVPSNNPDGSHYSFYDRSAQRRNMTNYCPRTGSADPLARGNWGVDLNRNFRVGSAHDGYTGASFSCTSDTYQGPEKLSEPEAKNVVWMAETFDNIKFFMTVHSSGGQLFWQPGSYIAQGRITTPRPPLADESYYWLMAEEILSNVKGLRDTVVQPRNVGGSSDVLYSSAGNVREDLYNNYGIYAFGWEVGGVQWNPATRTFTSGGGFMPAWPEANLQYQEYASGIISMFEIAMRYEQDRDPARTQLHSQRQADNSVDVWFSMTEPATIYYTTDGSTPTTDSTTYEANDIREPGEVLTIHQPTTFRWFSVDVKGNVEVTRSANLRARGPGG